MNLIGFQALPNSFTFSREKKILLTPSLSQKQKNQCITGRCFNRSESSRAENRDIHINFRPLEINYFSKKSAEVKETQQFLPSVPFRTFLVTKNVQLDMFQIVKKPPKIFPYFISLFSIQSFFMRTNLYHCRNVQVP